MNRARVKTRAAAVLCCGAALLLAVRGQAQEPAAPAEDARSENGRTENPYDSDVTWEEAAPPADERPEGGEGEPEKAAEADVDPADLDTAEARLAESPATASSPAPTSGPTPTTSPAPTEERAGPNAHRVTAIALTGLTFIGMGVGTSYAIQSTSQSRQRDALNDQAECPPSCSAAADRLDGQAHRSATVAQVAFAIGLVSLGGAAYLWLTDSSPDAPAETAGTAAPKARTGWQLDVSAAPGGGSAWLAGTF